MNKIIDIVGPYTGETLAVQGLNIERARTAAKFVWRNGGIAICPHLNTIRFDELNSYKHFLHGYCEILTRCDAIWLLSGWENSPGAQLKHHLAAQLDLTILQTSLQVLDYIKEAKNCSMQKMYR